ncbi:MULTISPECIES: hypothetical protein [Paenibacillus]|uniref:hypothetical protein n=1 Tax=Paenibacillus TaxID=44249 RepID=UPI00041A9752|nr:MULTISPECIES: hypothetical protein [Paenibacillus]KGP79863.1 hypothetical protein P363_0130850 [Paenibacillus sp. MAEPY1]KGP84661.1 hypothetical protein P364_0104455 [Paenibacillus sp. MAEPY2]OZQ65987.1 hypothetical protein CA599_19560 [Paenibacillus taichungensis]HBU84452.1 hypothetical protein [Paenibacillus sp.]
MNVWITVKSLGKRKPALAKQAAELPETTDTLRQLIKNMVAQQLKALQDKNNEAEWLAYLMPEDIQEQGEAGKVGFGAIYNEGVPDIEGAMDTAITAYEDGLFKVFLNDEELQGLDEPLIIQEDDNVVFIRFTMLAGRLW